MFDSLEVLDKVTLNFSPDGLLIMNITLAFIMFGVALDIKFSQFKEIAYNPKAVIIGIISQFLLLPGATFLLILAINPSPAVGLGMILVAACPGGNISNFISALSKANVALSVSLTAFATASSVFMTPLNFAFWGGLYLANSPLVRPIDIPLLQVFQTIFLLLGIPLILGILFSQQYPKLTARIKKPFKIFSIVAFMIFVILAFSANFDHFLNYIHLIIIIVILHNLIALAIGFSMATFFKLPRPDRRSITIETGIQNSGLALVLIFNPKIFPAEFELGGMAFIAAAWGIWHMVTGIGFGYYWSKRKLN